MKLTELQIYHALDEYRSGVHLNFDFLSTLYYDTYIGVIDLIEGIKRNPYHREKWNECRREWARTGM